MALLTIALLIDLIIGDPDWLWRRVPHPVVWMGKLIDWFDSHRAWFTVEAFDRDKNADGGFTAGIVLLVVMFVLARAVGSVVDSLGVFGWFIELACVAVLIAQKSLYDHVKRVAEALRTGGESAGRKAVSMIVGRDVSQLDESGVAKAAVESLAENFSDGVVAPVLWYAVFGLPGILFYKAVNTADSMIGHRNQKYENFGKAAAVLDDWMNWPAARFASILVWMAVMVGKGSRAARRVWEISRRDASSHRSPNAGWPESSFAAALNLSLGGARRYGDELVEVATLYPEGRDRATIGDVDAALSLFMRCCFCLVGLSGFAWLLFG